MGRDERYEGQYEKDPWRADWRPDPPPRGRQEVRGPGDPGAGYERRAEDEPHEPSESGHPREEGREPDWRPDWRPGPRYPPGPKGYQRSDERLREDISERLMEARYIDSSDVTVEVSGAKVVLDGTVPERRMKHAIEDLVAACPGVQDIDNKIRLRR